MTRARGRRTWIWLMFALMTAAAGVTYFLFFREPEIAKGSCLSISIPYDLVDRALPGLVPGGEETPSLLSVRRLLRRAKGDPRIAGVLIRLGPMGVAPGRVAEIAELIAEVRSARKHVTVHAPRYDLAAWIVASHADTISLAPLGVVDLRTPRPMLPFVAGALEKLGVAADFVKHGEEKALLEQLTREEPSVGLADHWQKLCDRISVELRAAASPKRPNSGALERAAAAGSLGAAQALADKWIDLIEDSSELEERLLGVEGSAIVEPRTYHQVSDDRGGQYAPPVIGVLSVEGVLLAGASRELPVLGRVQGLEELRRAIQEIGAASVLRGIILRIECAGSDVQVAEAVRRELDRIELPVVALLGTQATSGGYYIATACTEIYCSPATLVGAIGVVGGHWVVASAAQRLGIHPHQSALTPECAPSSWEPYSPEQRAVVTNELRDFYDAFVEHVRIGRRLDRVTALSAANGRVYTGREAVALGLVDGDGGWEAAWSAICEQAEIAEPARASFAVYPRTPGWWERAWAGELLHRPEFPVDVRTVFAAGLEARWYLGPIVVGHK